MKSNTATSIPVSARIRPGIEIPKILKSMLRLATLCLATYWAAIFVGTHLPKEALAEIPRFSDKTYHAIAFTGLAFLLAWSLPSKSRMQHLGLVAAIGLVYAAIDELTQKLIPGRSCEFYDFVADAFGICLGLAAYTLCRALLTRIQAGRTLIRILSR